ncbi:MAG TPA: S4 domain-containing protein [Candidatus Deferrimicrobium sp.]|nr:S4 domain-containing protein [Candidatus Deferrimicrobium sp.]
MRLDDFLSTVGIVKRRTIAKELAQHGMISVNGRTIKPAYQVRINDIIHIKGTHSVTIEVVDLPVGSVPRAERDRYFKELKNTRPAHD